MRSLAAGLLVASLLAGCASGTPSSSDPATAAASTASGPAEVPTDTPAIELGPTDSTETPSGAKAFEQTFGPDYAAKPPSGRPVWISSAELSQDQRTLTIVFVGGKAYLASNPCSEDYEPWVAARGDELDIEVITVAHADAATAAPNTACTLEGYGYTFHLKLPAPFPGTTVNDLAQGGTLYVGAPDGVAVATTLPAGWSLQRSFQEDPGPPPIWVQIYAAGPVGDEWEGAGQLVLYQAFGIVREWTETRASKSEARGGHAVAVTVHGNASTVWVDDESGELLLALTVHGQSLGLIGNSADMTPTDLARVAEGFTVPR